MIEENKHVEYFKTVAKNAALIMVEQDYGEQGIEKLTLLMDMLPKIFNCLWYQRFKKIIVFSPLEDKLSLSKTKNARPITCTAFENLAQLQGDELTIEVQDNYEILYSVDFGPDLSQLQLGSVIYVREKSSELILSKQGHRRLIPIPDTDCYFAIQTYKSLESALEDYGVKIARLSTCEYLQKSWLTTNRIFFGAGPEQNMRDSLKRFLQNRLRGGVEIRAEQNINDENPVDIKVTWNYTAKLAIIEIKWLGKSLRTIGENFTANYSESRVANGAKQLTDYLDANRKDAPDRITKGYLVIFDGRRKNTNKTTTQVSREDGFYYQNMEITMNPDYMERIDFAKPIRFFMEPEHN